MGLFDRSKFMNVLGKAKEAEKTKGYQQDIRFWNPEQPDPDKATTYKIRLLPIVTKKVYPEPEVQFNYHQFQSPISGKWVTEQCPSTIKQPCPICDYAWKMFNSGEQIDKDAARPFLPKQRWVTNILIVKEPNEARKENEGKVFMYKYGKKLHDKFQEAIYPDPDSGKESILFYAPEDGYDFLLVAKKVSDFPNYDSSEFARTPTPIAKSEEGMDSILKSVYDLQTEFLSPSCFKSPTELKEVLEKLIVGSSTGSFETRKETEKKIGGIVDRDDVDEPKTKKASPAKKEEVATVEDDDDFLKQLNASLGL